MNDDKYLPRIQVVDLRFEGIYKYIRCVRRNHWLTMNGTTEDAKKFSLMEMPSKEEGSVLTADDLKLAEMGYKPVSLFRREGADGVGTSARV